MIDMLELMVQVLFLYKYFIKNKKQIFFEAKLLKLIFFGVVFYSHHFTFKQKTTCLLLGI